MSGTSNRYGVPHCQQPYQPRSFFKYTALSPKPHPSNLPPVRPIVRPNISPRAPPSAQDRVIRFHNCHIIRNHKLIKEDLWVKKGKIVDPAKRFWEASQMHEYAADEVIDCKGLILTPGFIDLQLNGGFGFDFTSPWNETTAAGTEQTEASKAKDPIPSIDPAQIAAGLHLVSTSILKHGVTAYCITIITSSAETYRQLLPHYAPRAGSPQLGATVLGIHCEGPFITKRGAHNQSLMQTNTIKADAMISMYGRENLAHVRIITLAPEIDGMLDVIDLMHKEYPDIVLSAGHSSADYERALLAARHGVTLLTHLFNAMIPFTHRDPGIIGLIGCHDSSIVESLYYSIIADGIHTHAASIRIAYQAHPDGIILITDSMAAMGLGKGKTYHLGSTAVTVAETADHRLKAVVTGTDTLSGSIATMDECVRIFADYSGSSFVQAIESATLHPAQLLGLKEKGRLDVGCDADIVLMDQEMNLKGVWIDGQMAWLTENTVKITTE